MDNRGARRRAHHPDEPERQPAGFHPIAQGLARSSGALPIGDRGVGGSSLLFSTTHLEFKAGLAGLTMSGIGQIGRGDLSDDAARSLNATGPYGHRVCIPYLWEGRLRWYLPDFVGRTVDGKPVVIEAGVAHRKGRPKELAKLAAAQAWFGERGGELLVVVNHLNDARWIRGALALHLARRDFRGDPSLAGEIAAVWAGGAVCIGELVGRFAGRHDRQAVVAAALKVAGDLLASGRLDVDLGKVVLTLGTPIRERDAGLPPIDPPGVVRDLQVLADAAAAHAGGDDAGDEDEAAGPAGVDPDAIPDPAVRQNYLRFSAAAAEMGPGVSAAGVARRHALGERWFQKLWAAYQAEGPVGLVRDGRHRKTRGRRSLPARMRAKIGELYRRPERPSIQAIVDHPAVHELARELGMRRSPSRYQVSEEIHALLAADQATRDARAGRDLAPLTVSGRAVATEYVPGAVCEFDEAWADVRVLALAGSETTVRLHIGILIDVATRYPLGVVVSPKALDQWDIRRCVLRAALPDEETRRRFGVQTPSPFADNGVAAVLPTIIRTDNGKIERSGLMLQMAADAPFAIVWAPLRTPWAKPIVESAFKVLNSTFIHRLAITTKGSPRERGLHDPDAAARRGGIDADAFERALMQAVYDVYAETWQGGVRERPSAVLADALAEFPVRSWQGTPDELRRLLRRDEGSRKVDRHGVSYGGRWYAAPFLGTILGERVRIKVDEDDLRLLDVYDETGRFLGAARCGILADRYDRAVSRWELTLEDVSDAVFAAEAEAKARPHRDRIAGDLGGAEAARREGRRRHQAKRRSETQTATDDAALSAPARPAAPLPPTLPLPVADDDPLEDAAA